MDRDYRAAWWLTGLAVLGHMLRSRRFYERAAFTAIALAALGRLSQENRSRILARLTAWNKRQFQLLERKAGREARRLEHKAERQAKRLARKPKSALTHPGNGRDRGDHAGPGRRLPRPHQPPSGWRRGELGHVLGFLFGLLFFIPVFGLAIGAGLGALMGKFVKTSIDKQFQDQVRGMLQPGASALFLMLEKVTPVLKTFLSKDDEKELQDAPHGRQAAAQ